MQASTTRPPRGCCRRVTARANAGAQGAASASALFDAGYLTETYKQIAMLRGKRKFADRARTIAGVIGSADGTAIINRAITLRPDDAWRFVLQPRLSPLPPTAPRIAITLTRRGKARRRMRCWRGTSINCRKGAREPAISSALSACRTSTSLRYKASRMSAPYLQWPVFRVRCWRASPRCSLGP